MTNREKIHTDVQDLRRWRDEMRVQLHLGKAEARDLFDRLEQRWPEVERGLLDLEKSTAKAADEVADALRGVLGEIRKGYQSVAHRPKV